MHRVPIKDKTQLEIYLFNVNQSYYVGLLSFDGLMTQYKNIVEDVTFASRSMKSDIMSNILNDFNNFVKNSDIEFKKLIDIIKPFYLKKDFKQIKKILFFYRLNEYRKIKQNKNLKNNLKIDLKNKLNFIIRIIYEQPLIFENTIFPIISKDWNEEEVNDFKLDNKRLFIEFYDKSEFENELVKLLNE